MKKFNLMHFTTSENAENIEKEGFKISKHRPPKKNLWLGDGVYFYEASCEHANRQGKSIIEGKRNKEVVNKIIVKKIKINIVVSRSKIYNLKLPEERLFLQRNIVNEYRKRYPEPNLIPKDDPIEKLFKECILYLDPEKNIVINNFIGSLLGKYINFIILKYHNDVIMVQEIIKTRKDFPGIEQFCIREQKFLNDIKEICYE